MQGSEKQIKWANEVKAKFSNAIEMAKSNSATPEYTAVIDFIANNQDARFWIENKNSNPQDVMYGGGIFYSAVLALYPESKTPYDPVNPYLNEGILGLEESIISENKKVLKQARKIKGKDGAK